MINMKDINDMLSEIEEKHNKIKESLWHWKFKENKKRTSL